MKKFLNILLSSILVMSIFISCGNSKVNNSTDISTDNNADISSILEDTEKESVNTRKNIFNRKSNAKSIKLGNNSWNMSDFHNRNTGIVDDGLLVNDIENIYFADDTDSTLYKSDLNGENVEAVFVEPKNMFISTLNNYKEYLYMIVWNNSTKYITRLNKVSGEYEVLFEVPQNIYSKMFIVNDEMIWTVAETTKLERGYYINNYVVKKMNLKTNEVSELMSLTDTLVYDVGIYDNLLLIEASDLDEDYKAIYNARRAIAYNLEDSSTVEIEEYPYYCYNNGYIFNFNSDSIKAYSIYSNEEEALEIEIKFEEDGPIKFESIIATDDSIYLIDDEEYTGEMYITRVYEVDERGNLKLINEYMSEDDESSIYVVNNNLFYRDLENGKITLLNK